SNQKFPNVSDQPVSEPVNSCLPAAVILSCQVPRALCSSNAVSDCSGRNEPLNGATPSPTAASASSSKAVRVRLAPVPPHRLNRVTCCPHGETRLIVRFW